MEKQLSAQFKDILKGRPRVKISWYLIFEQIFQYSGNTLFFLFLFCVFENGKLWGGLSKGCIPTTFLSQFGTSIQEQPVFHPGTNIIKKKAEGTLQHFGSRHLCMLSVQIDSRLNIQ